VEEPSTASITDVAKTDATASPLIVPDDIRSTEKAPDYAGALSCWREKVLINTLRLPDRPNGN
jgi:hypothetical protein